MNDLMDSEPANFVDMHNQSRATLLSLKYELVGLASAFGRTGDLLIAEQLHDIAKELNRVRNDTHTVFSTMQRESLKMARDGTANLLGVVLAMSEKKGSP